MKKVILFFIIITFVSVALSQPETSSWDGVSYCVKDYLKQHLHDPKSLKVQDAYELMQADKDYIQRVTYRAKNAFGAYVVEDKVFFMQRVYGENRKYKVYDVWDFTTFLSVINNL